MGPWRLQRGAPPLVIAEIGVNFNGDLDIATRSIDAAVAAGAGAVKFQTFRADEFIADRDLAFTYASQGKSISENAFEMFRRLELSPQWHRELKAHAESRGAMFLSSAADPISVDLLVNLGVPVIKIASEDLINVPLLRHVATKKTPVLLSTGMAEQDEVDRAVALLKPCPALMLLHCTSLYPTPFAEVNLHRMVALADRYDLPVGFSDHSLGHAAAMAASTLGAFVIEKHFTLDKNLPGPDHAFSADPQELAALVSATRDAAALLGSGRITASPGEIIARRDYRRSIVAARELPAGTVLALSDLALKRPHTGLHPFELDSLVGRKTRVDLARNQQIEWNDLL
jgi:N-acetylneuraminate synthase/N,N'-diacetyllegionaminate synthase